MPPGISPEFSREGIEAMRRWIAELATLTYRLALENHPESRYVAIVSGFGEGRAMSADDAKWLSENIKPLRFRFYQSPGSMGKVGAEVDGDIGTAIAALAGYLADSDGKVHYVTCTTCGQPFLSARPTGTICFSCPRNVARAGG